MILRQLICSVVSSKVFLRLVLVFLYLMIKYKWIDVIVFIWLGESNREFQFFLDELGSLLGRRFRLSRVVKRERMNVSYGFEIQYSFREWCIFLVFLYLILCCIVVSDYFEGFVIDCVYCRLMVGSRNIQCGVDYIFFRFILYLQLLVKLRRFLIVVEVFYFLFWGFFVLGLWKYETINISGVVIQ